MPPTTEILDNVVSNAEVMFKKAPLPPDVWR